MTLQTQTLPPETDRLVTDCLAEQLTQPGEVFNHPDRVQRMADLLARCATALTDPQCECPCYNTRHRMSDHARLVRS